MYSLIISLFKNSSLRIVVTASMIFLLSGCALFEPADQSLKSFHTVILDPGHGGMDSGARASSGMAEKDLTLDVAQRLRPLLEAHGYRVIMTRSNDTFIPLGIRTAISNGHPDAIFVSIHFNASPSRAASGVETYYYHRASDRLAVAISRELPTAYGAHYRGVKPALFYVLNHNLRPATLLELGFVSNRKENALLQSPKVRQQLAERIALGIQKARGA